MNISYYQEISVLAEQLNFSKAAESLFTTQSTLSKHVSAVEKEAGFKIFLRTTSKVELTPAGRVFVAHIRKCLEYHDRAMCEGRRHQAESDSLVRVIGPLMNTNLLQLVSSAAAKTAHDMPGFRISITENGVRDCEERLIENHADIALAFRYAQTSRELHYDHLLYIPFGIACHAEHPLAEKKTLSFEDIRGYELTSYPLADRTDYHTFVSHACHQFGITEPEPLADSRALCFPPTINSIVFGVFFPDFVRFGGDLVSKPIDDDRILFDVCAVRRENEANQNIIAFYNNIIEAIGIQQSSQTPKRLRNDG